MAPIPVPATRELLEKVARAAASLVDVVYEFEDDAEHLAMCMQQPLEELDELLVAAGLRPRPPTPEEAREEALRWLAGRIEAHGLPLIPELQQYASQEQPRSTASRWETVKGRQLTERTLYRCTQCGRESYTPDKICGVSGCGHEEYPELARKWREGIPKRDQFFSGPVRDG